MLYLKQRHPKILACQLLGSPRADLDEQNVISSDRYTEYHRADTGRLSVLDGRMLNKKGLQVATLATFQRCFHTSLFKHSRKKETKQSPVSLSGP